MKHKPIQFCYVNAHGETKDAEPKIRAYYGRLQSAFERSNMGGIVDHLSMSSHTLAEEYAQARGYSIHPAGEITAQPGKDDSGSLPPDPDDNALGDYALVSRRELLIGRTDPLLREVIAAYFGPIGDSWEALAMHEAFEMQKQLDDARKKAKKNKELQPVVAQMRGVWRYGRLISLFHMTEPGRRMLEDEARLPASAPKAAVLGKMNRTMRRKAERAAKEAERQATGGAPFEDLALEQKLRTLHGRMVVLLAHSSAADRVREACACCELASQQLLIRAARAWNAADARIRAEQGNRRTG